MPICGKKSNIAKRQWLDFAEYAGIPERAAARVLQEQIDALEPSLRFIDASFLPDDQKSQYQDIVLHNTELLR